MALGDEHSERKIGLVESAIVRLADEHAGRISNKQVLELVPQIGPALIAAYLSKIVQRGDLVRLGRGLYELPGASSRNADVALADDAQRLADELHAVGAWALISGLDVLGAFVNQLPEPPPILVVALPGHGAAVEEAGVKLGLHVYVDPSPADLRVIRDLGRQAVVVRERSLDDHPAPEEVGYRRRIEDAWVDLASESQRSYPIEEGELAALLRNMAGVQVSWSRLARYARRRNIPAYIAPAFDPPIRVEPRKGSWQELSQELKVVG